MRIINVYNLSGALLSRAETMFVKRTNLLDKLCDSLQWDHVLLAHLIESLTQMLFEGLVPDINFHYQDQKNSSCSTTKKELASSLAMRIR